MKLELPSLERNGIMRYFSLSNKIKFLLLKFIIFYYPKKRLGNTIVHRNRIGQTVKRKCKKRLPKKSKRQYGEAWFPLTEECAFHSM